MTTCSLARERVEQLRNFAPGVSMASLFLVPPTGYIAASVEQQPVQPEMYAITSIADGDFDLFPVYIRTPQGLELISPSLLPASTKTEDDNIPHTLRDLTGLSVETLASLAKVSRNAYYKWLDGGGVSDEHVGRLKDLLETFRTLYDLLGSHLKEFLETHGPSGRPIDLLFSGNDSTVIGLALRPFPVPIDSPSVSNVARQISGLPSWLRPVTKLSWGTSHLTDSEVDEVLGELSPQPLLDQAQVLDDTDDDEAFIAWGFFLE